MSPAQHNHNLAALLSWRVVLAWRPGLHAMTMHWHHGQWRTLREQAARRNR
ncbi:hypothetical protein [Shimwellia pseudoproteus]|uniref:hypothetical protein n=1 Tax=Shimwellia pseudoproteus TaxID=570012 RepID=UPI0018ED9D65|nr:hypothetical protein [Shimwellia pseudoproteus]